MRVVGRVRPSDLLAGIGRGLGIGRRNLNRFETKQTICILVLVDLTGNRTLGNDDRGLFLIRQVYGNVVRVCVNDATGQGISVGCIELD